ncbi:MAG TPA: hypothetical protein VF331_02110 [Polyangiales bacterium]
MSTSFAAASSFAPGAAPGETVGSVPASWAQGRTSFGGLVAAIALRPMLSRVASERTHAGAQQHRQLDQRFPQRHATWHDRRVVELRSQRRCS